ncbi:aminodeoxychorismate synthase component I [Actinoplanes sp. NPDC051494]|uniref:aminodeoxychorismate synthase component I n=1 Tax=Actinoplanes sp. NPDC051494 TaxID=3363907 RepID=UPI0037A1075A
MRTLLVDNYDSFTYNLFHYLAEVNGADPVVVRNDDPGFDPAVLDEFDNVVLSPGPGSPDRPADVGICTGIIASARLPVLGVCLGHQGIAHVHGGVVERAPEPRHGRTSPVSHDGTGLFAGLPAPLEVVRYHSLAVTSMPAELEVTAWAPDGVAMALRHRTLPQWGVQFHPESIGTVGGHRLLANFARLSREHNEATGRAVRPPRVTGVPVTAGEPPRRRLRVHTRRVSVPVEAEAAFGRLFRGGPHAYWLDSSRAGGRLGEVSIMGDASGPLARIARADVPAGTVSVTSGTVTTVETTGFLDWLDRDLGSLDVRAPALPFAFALGWVGYLGYELKAECGGSAAHTAEDPDAVTVFADRALVLDHRTGTAHLLALAEDGDDDAAVAWFERTGTALAGLADAGGGATTGPAHEPGAAVTGGLSLRHDHDAYLDLIGACRREIAAGETYEVCLTNMVTAGAGLDPWQAYRFLRRSSPAPFAAYLSFGDVSVLSTSPERFLRIGADGALESTPIKGTRPRGGTEAEDALLVADLATSEKDHAENLMIVDLVRHDLGRCARVGSVVAGPVFQVETYAAAHQLVSTVRARLHPDRSAVQAVRAAFPPGSMTGAPKIRTMAILDRLEGGPRGVYSGAIGYFSLSGGVDLSVVIRTVVLSDGRARYGVGGAIIALSDADEEYEETAVKATPLLRLLGADFPLRSTPVAQPRTP